MGKVEIIEDFQVDQDQIARLGQIPIMGEVALNGAQVCPDEPGCRRPVVRVFHRDGESQPPREVGNHRQAEDAVAPIQIVQVAQIGIGQAFGVDPVIGVFLSRKGDHQVFEVVTVGEDSRELSLRQRIERIFHRRVGGVLPFSLRQRDTVVDRLCKAFAGFPEDQ